jgi:hypothetical protein
VELFGYEPVADRVWSLRSAVTAYDACYVALAEALDAPLATIDLRLSRAPGPRCVFKTPPHSENVSPTRQPVTADAQLRAHGKLGIQRTRPLSPDWSPWGSPRVDGSSKHRSRWANPGSACRPRPLPLFRMIVASTTELVPAEECRPLPTRLVYCGQSLDPLMPDRCGRVKHMLERVAGNGFTVWMKGKR